MLSSYLSPSRHGIYYFRWPLPTIEGQARQTIKLSLRTRCPDRAGDLARHLASCGRAMRDNNDLTAYKRNEVREMVTAYFKAQLQQYLHWLDTRGLTQNALEDVRWPLSVLSIIPLTMPRPSLLLLLRSLQTLHPRSAWLSKNLPQTKPVACQIRPSSRTGPISAFYWSISALSGYWSRSPSKTPTKSNKCCMTCHRTGRSRQP